MSKENNEGVKPNIMKIIIYTYILVTYTYTGYIRPLFEICRPRHVKKDFYIQKEQNNNRDNYIYKCIKTLLIFSGNTNRL